MLLLTGEHLAVAQNKQKFHLALYYSPKFHAAVEVIV